MAETMDDDEISERIAELAAHAERDRQSFVAPPDPPAEEQAKQFLREGAGPAIWLYIEARVDGFVHLPPEEFEALEGAMNDWFELYARCYGVDLDAEFSIREAAEALLETHNVFDVARILTHLPVEAE
jgi:hypothetical protein